MTQKYIKVIIIYSFLALLLSACNKEDFRSAYIGCYVGPETLSLTSRDTITGPENFVCIELDPSDEKTVFLDRAVPTKVKLKWVDGKWILPTQIRRVKGSYGFELSGTVDLSEEIIDYQIKVVDINPNLINADTLIIKSTARRQ